MKERCDVNHSNLENSSRRIYNCGSFTESKFDVKNVNKVKATT